MTRIYLDHHATTPVDPRVLDAMLPYFTEMFGNPGSVHAHGRDASDAVERARAAIATAIGAEEAEEILFTSGATESDNLALRGVLTWSRQRGGHLITTAIEHNAVLKVAEQLRGEGFRVTVLPVDHDGLVDVTRLAKCIRAGEPTLVSVMAANNEIGTVQPIAEIGRVCRELGALFHCDATQAVGKIPFDVIAMCVDLASISAHKMYGPKGVGALYVRREVSLCPSMLGGGQERGLRPGTLNVAGIVGFGVAAELAAGEMDSEAARVGELRDHLLALLADELGDRLHVNGSIEHRLPGNLSICLDGVDGRELVAELDARGVCVSTGSACSRGLTPSHVLLALGHSEEQVWSAIRIGLGRGTTLEDIETAAAEILDAVRAPVLHVAGAPADENEDVVERFTWTIQYDAVPRAARVVRLPEDGGLEMRFEGVDGQPRRVPVDIDYRPERLDRAPAGLERLATVTSEVGLATRVLWGWVSPKHRDLGTVIPFGVGGVTYAARLEKHWNAPVGLSVYRVAASGA
ncbi:MAG: cysteine desulfurase [Anaerolineales bacterium]|nr:cysteine desulfurase [Anaerolineales bacterium]